MGRTLEYIVVTLIVGGFAIWIASLAGEAISTSLNASAEMIERAGR